MGATTENEPKSEGRTAWLSVTVKLPYHAAEVADVHAHARRDLLLDPGRELPVVRPPAPALQHLGIVAGARDRLPVAQIRDRPAEVAAGGQVDPARGGW